MKLFCIICAITFALITSSAIALAAPEKFSLDKELTYVGFSVSYLGIFPVTGRFDDFRGAFVIDREHPENNRADIVIRTNSVDAGSKSRNADIRGPALFNTEAYPEMIFHSDTIELGPENAGLIAGKLTLRGVTRSVTLDFIRIPDAETQETRKNHSFADGLAVTGNIKRSDFGMNDYIVPVGDTVTLFVCYKLERCDDIFVHPQKKEHRYNQ